MFRKNTKERSNSFKGTAVVFLAIAAGVWIFLKVASIAMEGEPLPVEESILLSMRNPADPADPIGPVWFEEAARDITALGGLVVLSIVVALATAFLLLTGKRRAALFFLAAILSGTAASTFLKEFYGRVRPDLVAHKMETLTLSFPSGHSMLAALVYLTIGALLASTRPRKRVKVFIVVVSGFIAVIVGLSRLYLGVHWPTDVVAGWSAGTVWCILWWKLARAYLPRKEMESSVTEEQGLST